MNAQTALSATNLETRGFSPGSTLPSRQSAIVGVPGVLSREFEDNKNGADFSTPPLLSAIWSVYSDHGSSKATLVGMTGFEPATSSSRTTRATKLRHIPLFSQRNNTVHARLDGTKSSDLLHLWDGLAGIQQALRVQDVLQLPLDLKHCGGLFPGEPLTLD